jgi:replication factor C subunit 2/4
MASFFDLKARKAAAAANGTSSNKVEKKTTENKRAQPWVEK